MKLEKNVTIFIDFLKKNNFPPIVESKEVDNTDLLNENVKDWCISEKLLVVKEKKPTNCPECNSTEIKSWKIKTNYVVRCNKHEVKIPLEEFIYFQISYEQIFKTLMPLLNFEITSTEIKDEDYYLLCQAKHKHLEKINCILLFKEIKREMIFFPILKTTISENIPSLIITPYNNINRILDIQAVFSAGNLTLVLPFDKLGITKLYRKLSNWLENMKEIRSIEKTIVDSLVYDRRIQVSAISSNPRYLLTLLNQIEVRKIIEGKDFEWEYFEDLVAWCLSYVFPTEVMRGGYKDQFKPYPDSFLIIPDGDREPDIIGLVDCKSSFTANWDNESTRKYEDYIGNFIALKQYSPKKKKIAIIFVVFNYKESSLVSLRDNIKLEKNQYIIVLPVRSLSLFMDVLMKGILRMKYIKGARAIHDFFDIDFYEKSNFRGKYNKYLGDAAFKSQLIVLEYEMVLNELKEELLSSSEFEDIFEHYFTQIENQKENSM